MKCKYWALIIFLLFLAMPCWAEDFKPKLITVLKDCWDSTSRCIGAGCGCQVCGDCYYYEDGTKKCKEYREICGT